MKSLAAGSGRLLFLEALLAAFVVYVIYRLVCAHLNEEIVAPDYTYERELPALRGSIYDRYGEEYPLAKSVPVWEYRLDPVSLTNTVVKKRGERRRNKGAIMKTVADALSLDYEKIMNMTDNVKNRYQFLAISSDADANRTICDSKLVAGIAIEDRQIREYLHNRSLCHVLGSVNAEHVGSAGIEQRYNRDLTGIPGKIIGKKDARGRELYDKREISIDPRPGADIYLTIDHNIQSDVESILEKGIKEYGAGSGWCVVMDAKTGAIYALASFPDFNPSEYNKAGDEAKRNRVTNLTYEPGSVMKVITAAAAIDTGLVRPETRYRTNRNDDRYYRLPSDGSHTWEPTMTITDAIVHSSNIVIGKLGVDLGPKKLYEYMCAFGFGKKTGIELPGEEAGILPYWEKWDKVKWSRAPIGQGVSVTAMQLVSAYQAIANNGLRMRPYIIDKIVASDGTEILKNSPEPLGRPISARTARQMRAVMLGVASKNGTARRAAIRGYSVAGKTGTAQKVINGRYSDSLYRATFCGIVPATDPKLVVLVTLDFEQRTKFHQGGNSSGPIFKSIASSALRYLMVEPDRPDEIEEFDSETEFEKFMESRGRKYDIIENDFQE